MALGLQFPAGLRSTYSSSSSSSCSSSKRPPRAAAVIPMKASLKQHETGSEISYSASPLLNAVTTEEIASSFGLELTVLELERLFKQTGRDATLLPQLSGPSHPSPSIGFSGRPPVRVAYQGVPGSYCQEAAMKAFSSVCDAFPCNNMEEAFQAIEERSADRAIIPIENSIDGPIDRNFDLLLRHDGIQIVSELILPVNHCLLAVPGVSRSNLKRIISHPQALSHCKTKLECLSPHLEIDEVPNAADAARYVSENRIADTAVIGSRIAGREFGLQLLEQNFQDPNGNFNRFLQLGLEPPPVLQGTENKARAWKTTVAFSLENGVSDLFRALWLFESRNVTVTRVEHRPNRSNPVRVVETEGGDMKNFDYIFILDLEGNMTNSGLVNGITQLKQISGFLRVLGSYTCALQH